MCGSFCLEGDLQCKTNIKKMVLVLKWLKVQILRPEELVLMEKSFTTQLLLSLTVFSDWSDTLSDERLILRHKKRTACSPDKRRVSLLCVSAHGH